MSSSAATPKPSSKPTPAQPTGPTAWNRVGQYAAAHPRLAWCAAWLAVFLALVAWRREILTSPPYWDYAMGLMTEADFLVETNFDYAALIEQRRFGAGGVATYITSLMPTLVAVVMKFSPSVPASLLVLHLLNIAAAATVALTVFALVKRHAEPRLAALAALATLTTPLFAAQVDMLGMDMALTAAALLSVKAFVDEKYSAAWLWAALAWGVKASGMLAAVAIVVLAAARLLFDWGTGGRQLRLRRALAVLASLALLAAEWWVARWVNSLATSHSEQMNEEITFGWETLRMTRVWCPDLIVVLGVGLALATLAGLWGWVSRWRRGEGAVGGALGGIAHWLRERPIEPAAWLMVLATLTALLLAYAIPRYLLLPLPFLWIAVTLALRQCVPAFWMAAAFLVAASAVNLLNENGRFYPSLEGNDRTGAMLERSREYRVDHLANIVLVQGLERGFSDQPIVAGNPFVYFLALPRLGYLRQGKPLYGYSLNTFSPPTFPDVRRLVRDAPQQAVFVWAQNSFTDIGWCRLPQPQTGDSVLFKDSAGRIPVVLYRKKSWTPEELKMPMGRRYRNWLFANDPGLVAELEIETPEQQAAAERQLRADLAENPDDVDSRHNLGVVLARQKRLEEALVEYERALELRPRRADTNCRRGDALADLNRFDEAIAAYRKALEIDEEFFDAHRGFGVALARQEKYADAQRPLKRAAALQPFDASVWFQLGMSQRLSGDADEARKSFLTAIEKHRDDADSLLQLGLLEEERGHDGAAIGFYRRAVAAKPLPAAVNNLAWLLSTSPLAGVRNGKDAVALAEAACQQTKYSVYGLVDTLAAAYAEVGRFSDAVQTAQRAAQMALDANEDDSAVQIRHRINLYEKNQPFRREK